MGRSRFGPLALALAALPATAALADGLYLHVIPTAAPARARIDPAAPLRVAVYTSRASAGSGASDRRSLAANRVELDLDPYPQLAPAEPERFLSPTFVVDYDEPAVVALRAELARKHGERPTIEELRSFTAEAIPNKSMQRPWDLASQVAKLRVGDCTEHAVLLAALSRSFGRPARVVLGLVVLAQGGDYQAFGHAWTEVHDGRRWLVADATASPALEPAAYLPLGVLEDEGPGYAMALGRLSRVAWIERVEVVGNASASPP